MLDVKGYKHRRYERSIFEDPEPEDENQHSGCQAWAKNGSRPPRPAAGLRFIASAVTARLLHLCCHSRPLSVKPSNHRVQIVGMRI